MGIIPPKMVTSVIAEDPTQRVQIVQNGPEGRVAEYVVAESETHKLILTGYDPQSGYFDVNVESNSADEDLDHMIREDRKSVVEGKSVSVRVKIGGRRNIKTKKTKQTAKTN